MKKSILFLLLVIFSTTLVFAYRTPAPELSPICVDGKIYSVKYSGKRVFTASLKIESEDGETIRIIPIYKKRLNPFMEADVQWVFIKEMKLIEDHIIYLTNEKNENFRFDVKTNRIKKN